MDTSFVCQGNAFCAASPLAGVLSSFHAYKAPVVKTLVKVYFHFDLTEMLVMVAMFVAALVCAQYRAYQRGYRHGYRHGFKEGNRFPRLRVGSPYWNWLARVFAE